MGLFYAYLKYHSDREYGYLIAFANREVADEWWRSISTLPSPYYEVVERTSPQLYVQNQHNDTQNVLWASDTDLPSAQHFSKRMYVTAHGYGYERRSVITIPPVTITDHVSGKWYLIRSNADPSSHWYLRIHGACLVCGDTGCDAIHVSSEYRTKFCVRVRGPHDSQEPKDFIMIGKDEILITARKDYTLHIDDAGNLKATKGYQGETDLLFDDLKNRFIIRSEKKVNGEVWEYVEPVEKGSGEVWELAD